MREVPDLMLKLQSGKFDAPDRLFQSISRTWNGVLTSAGDGVGDGLVGVLGENAAGASALFFVVKN